jgi:hypothetical protein
MALDNYILKYSFDRKDELWALLELKVNLGQALSKTINRKFV